MHGHMHMLGREVTTRRSTAFSSSLIDGKFSGMYVGNTSSNYTTHNNRGSKALFIVSQLHRKLFSVSCMETSVDT